MKKYMMFEQKMVSSYKRGLVSFEEAIASISSYLRAMVDFGIIEKDRLHEEITITTKKLLEIDIDKNKG